MVESLQTESGNILDFPRRSGLLTNDEIDITENYDAVSLLEAMASGELTSLAVTTAFCKRAAIAHQLVRHLLFRFQIHRMLTVVGQLSHRNHV